jgi:isoleucyl-tRNA synthetase
MKTCDLVVSSTATRSSYNLENCKKLEVDILDGWRAFPIVSSKMSRFANVTDKLDFAAEEERTLAYWTEIDAFQTSLKLSEGKPEFTFYDGPPFATGLPHYGHILAGTIKDTVTRYAHQTGHYVSRRFGWDCHGLPVEYEIDKKLKITGRDMVLEMGVANYNNECRSLMNNSLVDGNTVQW